MLIDIIWKTFEQTGDAMCYLEYTRCKDMFDRVEKNDREEDMDKTG